MTQKHVFHLFSFFVWAGLLSGSLLGQQATPTSAAKPTAQPASPPASSLTATSTQPLKTPEEFFARARKLSDLEVAGVPFHLKATFVATGDAEYTGNGTFEEWWKSKTVWRKEATLGSYKYVAVHNGAVWAASATMVYTPLRVRQVENLAISRVELPSGKDTQWPAPGGEYTDWVVSKIAATPSALEALTMRRLIAPKHMKNLYFIWQYCFGEDGALRSYRYNDLIAAYRNFQPFGKLSIPREITVSLQTVPVLTVGVSVLEALPTADSKQFDPQSIPNYGAEPAPVIVRFSKKTDTPAKFTPPSNFYEPRSISKLHPKSGGVAIMGAVDTTGRVREPYISVSGGPKFDTVTLDVVRRRYKFKPARRNGRLAVSPNTMMSFSNDSSFWSHFW